MARDVARPEIDRLLQLQQMLNSFSGVERAIISPHDKGQRVRWENDVEHSYALAMFAWYLASRTEGIDVAKCINYALVHDLVEVYAGDTFAYETSISRRNSKQRREEEARQKLRSEWADFDGLNHAIEAYERLEDKESRLVYALDKLLPILMNMLDGGKSWQYHQITLEMLKEYKTAKVAISPEIKKYYDQLLAMLEAEPDYFVGNINGS
jgi:putative hydrolase of HD superfamily